jgi:XTP/dITP diphosphohydrolase
MPRPSIVLCSGNPGKVVEFRELLKGAYDVLGLEELGMPTDLPETGNSLEENALQKARYVFERTGLPCLADDTGLEVPALNGAPGVHSARYAGMAKDPRANMAKLLAELARSSDRTARFRTVLALVSVAGERCFEGVVDGHIATGPSGDGGFGYDPVFIPDGYSGTFAELDPAVKNAISHRALAVALFAEYMYTDQPLGRSMS